METKTLTSLEVAEMIGKEHKNMMRDIRKYIEDITHNLENSKLSTQNCESGVENSLIELSDYFIESTYQGQRRKEKCYLITKKGCEFIYNKLQGKRGNKFTFDYVEKFNAMEEHIKETSKVIYESSTKEELKEKLNDYRFSNKRTIKTFENCLTHDLEVLTDEFIEHVITLDTEERISKCRSAIKGIERFIENLNSNMSKSMLNGAYVIIATMCKERIIQTEHMAENRRNGGIKASQTKAIKELQTQLSKKGGEN